MCEFYNHYHSLKGGISGKDIKINKCANETDLTSCAVVRSPNESPAIIIFSCGVTKGYFDITFFPMCGRKLSEVPEMNKSDLEKMRKFNEEYEKHMNENPFQSEIDRIAKSIRERQDSAMAMEFTQKIGQMLRDNGVVPHITEYKTEMECTGNSVKQRYGVEFDSLDFTEHDKKFTKKIEKLEECIEKLDDEITRKAGEIRDTDDENIYLKNELYRKNCSLENYVTKVEELKQQVAELESELSVKENLLKIKSGLCEESDLMGLSPIEVAEKLIYAQSEYETNGIKRALGAGEKASYNIFSVSELKQIAEHLLVYCNHQKENENE